MPRYRDMTVPELIKWARDWDANDKGTNKLIFALTARLQQIDRDHRYGREPAPPEPDAPAVQPRERARTIDDVIKLGRLSREARDYLASKGRPTVPLADRPAASQAMDEHSLRAQQRMANMAGHHGGFYTTQNGQVFAVPATTGQCSQPHPLGHVPAPCSVWPIATRGY